MKESVTFDVQKPAREAFEALTDLERLAAMSGGQVSLQAVDGKPRAGKGSCVVLKASVPGPAAGDILCETLEWDPPKRCVRRLAIKDLPTTIAMTFEARGEGARVTLDIDVEPQSFMYKMMLPALAMKLKADKEKLAADFQRRLSQQGPAQG